MTFILYELVHIFVKKKRPRIYYTQDLPLKVSYIYAVYVTPLWKHRKEREGHHI